MRENNFAHLFIEYLINKGYPPESIIEGYRINKNILDVVIIDIETENVISVFEFKSMNLTNSKKEILQLKNISNHFPEFPVQLYIVNIQSEPINFELYYLDNDYEKLVPIKNVPLYESLKSFSSFALKIKKSKKERKTYDTFKIICWMLAGIITILLAADFLGFLNITPERMGVIAIIIGLIVVPSAKKLNMLGLEFERLISGDKK